MKRSTSNPGTSLGNNGKPPKKPKLSSTDIQQVLDTVIAGDVPPPVSSSTVNLSPVASRLRPRPRAPLAPKTKAPRKTKPPTKLPIQSAPAAPPSTSTTTTAPPKPSSSPPKATPQVSASTAVLPGKPVKFLVPPTATPAPPPSHPSKAAIAVPVPPPSNSTASPPITTTVFQRKVPPNKNSNTSSVASKAVVAVSLPPAPQAPTPIPPPGTTSFAPPPPNPTVTKPQKLIPLTSFYPLNPPPTKATVVPPKTKPTPAPPPTIPPNLPLLQNQTPSSVTPEAAKILVEISPTQFTPSFLQSSTFQASLLPPSTPEYALISTYISNSQPHPFNIELQAVLNITLGSSSPSTSSGVTKNPPKRFCMMLWHGTKPLTVAPILQNGFRCPQDGKQMFGQGIYFADRISKSAKYCIQDLYCTTPKPGEIGYIFLCEVTLGRCYNAKNSNSGYKSAPQITKKDGSVITFDSLKCTGQNIPERLEQREIDGVIWPMGQTVTNTKFPSYTVLYNEFIVYNPDMVEIRYLAKVKFS